nr:hypothetical protein [Tanacetum cinerariifolium]
MSTRSSARNLFPPLDNPVLTIRKRSRADPTLLNDFEMTAEGNGDLPVPDLRTMEELCQPSLNGRGGPIAPIGDDANKNLDKLFHKIAKMFLGKCFPPSMVMKLRNEITNFCQCPDESLFEAWEHYKLSIDRCPNHNMLPVTQIDSFYNGLTLRHRDTINAVAGGTFMKRRPEECYELIKNMIAQHNDWDTSAQQSESSSSITSSFDTEIAALKAEMAEINKNLMRVLQVNQQLKAVTPNYKTCGGPYSFTDCPANVGQTQNIYVAGAYQGDVPGATQEDLFGHDARPRPAGKPRPAKKTKSDATASTSGSSASTQFGELMEQKFRLKRKAAERDFEAQAEKDCTLMRLEELRFLATSTKDLDDDDAYWIKKQKRLIKNKIRNDLGDEDNEDE